MMTEQPRWKGQKGNPHQVQIVQPKDLWVHVVQVMDKFMVRDPGNRADQEADDIYRETRGERQQRVNHSSIVDIGTNVFQVDVENKQGNRESDDSR